MEDLFKKKAFAFGDVLESDKGVSVEKVKELIKFSEFSERFYDLLNIKEIENEFIAIPGADKLVQTMINLENSFEKFDLDSSFKNLEFSDTKPFSITFKNIDNEEINLIIDSDELTAKPIYSSQADFFSGIYSMDRYARKLLNQGFSELVLKNLEYVKEIYKEHPPKDKRYRIIRDKQNNYYLRAITSKQYSDYNNNIAVFVGLITLHKEMKSSNNKFYVERCEFNESYVRVFFGSNDSKQLPKIGTLKNIIEVSNDEVKREALRFTCSFTINYESENKEQQAIFIKPQRAKSHVLSIKHNVLPQTAIVELASLSNYKSIQQELLKDIEAVSKIQKPDQIKFLVKRKIEYAKSGELKKYKRNILSELTTKVDNITQLLEMMHKINLLAEDIDAKEYLRYIVYEALVYNK
ncbi:MAG: hypothetical protein V4548_12185 [Bacteroidota bacterium]